MNGTCFTRFPEPFTSSHRHHLLLESEIFKDNNIWLFRIDHHNGTRLFISITMRWDPIVAVAESSRKKHHGACISKLYLYKSLKKPVMKNVNTRCFLSKIQENSRDFLSITEKVFKTVETLKKTHTIIWTPLLCLKHLLKCPMKTRVATLRLFTFFCGEMAISSKTHVAKMIVLFHSPCSNTDTGPFIALYQWQVISLFSKNYQKNCINHETSHFRFWGILDFKRDCHFFAKQTYDRVWNKEYWSRFI
mgnify:CR=1 FL=1